MIERITPRKFHEAHGVKDWRVLFGGACAHFRTGSFATGVALVDAVGAVADAAGHHPDVDLRYGGVTVRPITHEVDGLSERDVQLARQISAAARGLDVSAQPTAVQTVQVAIDALASPEVMPFWRALLGYQEKAGGPGRPPRPRAVDLVPGHGRAPPAAQPQPRRHLRAARLDY